MLFAFFYSCLRLLLDVADVRLRLHNPEAEMLLLRHELRVLRRQINRPELNTADRIVMAAFHRLVSRPALGGLVEPETVLVGIGSWCAGNGQRSAGNEASDDPGWTRASES